MIIRREQGARREPKEGRMLQSSENSFNKAGSPAVNPNAYNPVKTVTAPVDQATIGRTLVIKGEISGSEALYIDGRIEGKITMPESRVTIGRNGKVDASIQGPIRCVPEAIQAEAARLDSDGECGQSIVGDGKLAAALHAAFNDDG